MLTARVKQNIEVFDNLEDFVDHVVSRKASRNVKLENAQNLITCFSRILIIVFLEFVMGTVPFKQLTIELYRTINRKFVRRLFRVLKRRFKLLKKFTARKRRFNSRLLSRPPGKQMTSSCRVSIENYRTAMLAVPRWQRKDRMI